METWVLPKLGWMWWLFKEKTSFGITQHWVRVSEALTNTSTRSESENESNSWIKVRFETALWWSQQIGKVVFNLRCGHSTLMVEGGGVAFKVRIELIDPSVIRMAKQWLKTWLNDLGNLLLSQKTWIWFPAPVTLVPRDQMPSFVFREHYTHAP